MVFGVGQFNYASHIWLGHTLVAMATKIFNIKLAITQLVQEIHPRFLHLLGGFRDRVIYWCQSDFAQTTTVVMVTKNWDFYHKNWKFYQKICHNFGCI